MILKLNILVLKICLMMSTYEQPVAYFSLDIRACNIAYDRMRTGTLTLIRIFCAREVFMTISFLHNRLILFRTGDALGRGF